MANPDGASAHERPRLRARLAGALRGHAAAPTRARFSADGRLLISGAEDGANHRYEIALWDVERRALLRMFDTPGYSPTFAPDAQTIAFGAIEGGRVLLADLEGQIVGELHGQANNAVGIVFSPDGSLLAVGDTAGQVRLWEVAKRRIVATFAAQQHPQPGLIPYGEPKGFSADGHWLRVDAADQLGAAQLFALGAASAGAISITWRAALGASGVSLWASACARRGSLVALTTVSERGILLARMTTLEQTWFPSGASANRDMTLALAFSPDSLWLAAATAYQGRVAILDVISGEVVLTWDAHTDYYQSLGGDQVNAIYDLDWSATGQYIATAGLGVWSPSAPDGAGQPAPREDHIIRLWEIERDPPWPFARQSTNSVSTPLKP